MNTKVKQRMLIGRQKMIMRSAMIATLIAISASTALSNQEQKQPTVTATLSIDRSNVFENEIFTLTMIITNTGIRLNQEMSFSNFSPNDNLELIGGFKNYKIQPAPENRTTYNIEKFVTHARIKNSGKIIIAPRLHAKKLIRTRSFFGVGYRSSPYIINVKPLKLYIQKLPEKNKPQDFSGAIGQCSFNVNVTPTSLAVGELITVAMIIKCPVLLDEIPTPAISPGRNFKAYPTKLMEDISSSTQKIFHQILVPQSTNAVSIPAVSFSYFDPRANSYKTTTKGPFALHFHKIEQEIDIPYIPTASKTQTTNTSQTETTLITTNNPEYQTKKPPSTNGIEAITEFLKRIFTHPEKIAIKSGTARITPSTASLPSFEIKKRATLLIIEKNKNWYKIELRNKRGWIPADIVTMTE